jgi:hypothetical protein
MSGPAELTDRQRRQLREVYATLHELAASDGVPAVVAASRAALAEVHAALVGQGLEFDFYSHRWLEART